MKNSFILGVAALAGASALFAAEPWEDPAVNSINRLPARAITIPCQSEDLALDILQRRQPRSASKWVIDLNGEWDFKWKSATAVPDWEKAAKIAVPGCWQLQGDYDPPLYSNCEYPFEPDAPRVTTEPKNKEWTTMKFRDPVGLYTTTFKRPWRWWFRRTILHFNGVSSAFYVRVNGKDVGYAEDSRLPSEFDLTPYLKWFGENTLEVEVHKHCDGSYVEDQDFWRLSGIFRDVYLLSESKSAPYDLVVETQLSEDLSSGKFIVRDEKGAELKVRELEKVQLWSPDYPFVYMTPIEHRYGWWIFGGTEYRAVTFGFRKVEIKDSVIYLNGKRVLFKGANRHEMSPERGYAITLRDMEKDIELFRRYNVNACRTCHYPDDPAWYDLCDRDGIMTVCEANVEAHGYNIYDGTTALSFRKDYEWTQVERAERMIKTYRNHPSILIWSMGNESGYGPNFKAEYKAMRAIDPTRPIQYECFNESNVKGRDKAKCGLAGDEADYTDVECPMYWSPKGCEDYVKDHPKKPFVLCEYVHAMGNSTGNLQEYWDLAKKYPSFQGGFVWDFADQAVWKQGRGKREEGRGAGGKYLAYGGDFGDLPNADNFNCNGIFDALRNPHPGAFEMKHVYQNVRCESFDFRTGKVKIRNEFLFKELDEEYYCQWESWQADGTPAGKGEFDFGDSFPAGAAVERTLKDFAGDAVVIKIYDDDGCIAWDSFARPFVPREEGKVKGERGTDVGLKFNLWRPPTDNDRGWQMPKVCKVWKDATESQKLPAGVKSDLKTSALADGSTLVDWTLVVPKGLPPIPRVGLTFTVPKTAKVEYFGLGPWENYADRATAAVLGRYAASVGLVSGLADPKTGTIAYPEDRLNPDDYSEPGEQGYRTGCRWLKVGDVTIEAVNAPFGFNVWPYTQTMLEGKKHQFELSAAEELTVNVDAVQMGVGGDNAWGARPHEPYMPGAGTYRLTFKVSGK